MSLGKTQALFVAMLLYAGGATYYVVTWMSTVVKTPAFAQFELSSAAMVFFYMVASAICFMILVAVVDLIARRKQQLLLALSVGLGAAASAYAVPVAFIKNSAYSHDMQISPATEQPAPAETR